MCVCVCVCACVCVCEYVPISLFADQQKFQGSYYVLEVGNFDRSSRVQVSPPLEVSPPPGDPMHPGYYMLDIRNFEKGEEPETLGWTGGMLQRYENVTVGSNSPEGVVTQSPSPTKSQSTPTPPTQSQSTPTPPTQSQSSPTPPSQSPTPTSHSEPLPVEQRPSTRPTHQGSTPRLYENIQPLAVEEPPPLPKKTRSRSALEATPINSTSSPPTNTVTASPSHAVSDKDKRSSLRRRDMVYEAIDIGRGRLKSSDSSPTTSPVPVPEPVSDSPPTDSGSTSLASISTSQDPFAGLVISSSIAMDGSVPPTELVGGSHGNNVFRNRTETVWDNDRVEMEWNQVQ